MQNSVMASHLVYACFNCMYLESVIFLMLGINFYAFFAQWPGQVHLNASPLKQIIKVLII